MKKLETDVAVVSAGTAGLAAAVAAAERGAKVMAFEKASTTGGTANMGMGPFAVESRLQKIKNVPLTKEDAFRVFMDYTHWRVDARLVSDYINKTADTIEWLEKMGVEFWDVIAYVKGSQFTHHVVKPSVGLPGPMCASTMMKAITERAKGLGVQIHLQTPVRRLIKERNKIVGLIAEDKEGEQIQVSAKAVIIATGGFGDSPELIKKYTGYEWGKDIFSMRVPGMVGEGIKMAWDVGAGQEGLNMELTCGIPTMAPDPTKGEAMVMPDMRIFSSFGHPNLMVNLLGERFMNEEVMGNPTFCGNAVSRQKGRCGFVIFDQGTLEAYEKNGFDWLNVMSAFAKTEGLVGVIKEACQGSQYIFMADSLEELAGKTGINPATLAKSVEEYNKACDTGRDTIFHKNPKYLRALKKPTFFAGRYQPSAYGSLGGIKINYKTEVVTKDQDVIPGLYAAGVDGNSIFADSYIFILPGSTMGFALNSGRIAGENAAEYTKSVG
jgi:fumarate reductase flavoprotein subunit